MPAHDSGMAAARNVIIEFIQIGAYVKVSAIDPVTLTEVSIVGDPARGEAALRRAAAQRLDYVLARGTRTRAPARR